MKFLALIGLLILLGCAGSPTVTVNKNVTNTITINGEPCPIERCGSFIPVWISIEVDYTTKSELDTKLEVDQDIKPETTIPFPGL